MKRNAPRLAVFLLLTVLLASCAGPQKKLAATPSGRPELEIATGDLESVKACIAKEMQGKNYDLWSPDSKEFVFMKEVENPEAVKRFRTKNSLSTAPMTEVRYDFKKKKKSVKVVAFISVVTQREAGRLEREDMKENIVMFNDMFALLERVKEEVEALRPAPVKR